MPVNTSSIRFTDATILTLASGVVTVTDGYHIIASESGTADDLDTITPSFEDTTVNSVNYRPMLLIKADTGDTITVKHGTGNIQLSNSTDYDLSGDLVLQLFYDGTNWVNVDIASAGGGGEVNTASNVGTGGVGLFKQKTGVDLEFKNVNAGSSKITVTDDMANNEVDIDVAEANLTLDNLGGTLAISKGGTGATTASGARTNLDTEQVISGRTLTSATVATDDKVLIQDTSASDALKTVTAQSIADLASGGGGVEVAQFAYRPTVGTNGDAFTSGAIRTATLNSTVVSQTWASISSNQLTLNTAGTYVIQIMVAVNQGVSLASIVGLATTVPAWVGHTISRYTGGAYNQTFHTEIVTIGASTTYIAGVEVSANATASTQNALLTTELYETYTLVTVWKVA